MSKISATMYDQKIEATKEKIIIRREYDHYTKKWGYLVGFPNAEANRGRIACLPMKIYDDGRLVFECFDEADKIYFTNLKLVHKGTDEAEQVVKALKDRWSSDNEDYVVGEKITRKDRCY